MLSATDSCGQVVGGNYDVVITTDNDTVINNQQQKHNYHSAHLQHQFQHQEPQLISHNSHLEQQAIRSSPTNQAHTLQQQESTKESQSAASNQTYQETKIEFANNDHQHQQHHEQHDRKDQHSRPSPSPSASSSAGSVVPHFGRALTNYLEHFEQLELELEQAINSGLLANCGYANEFHLLKEFSKQLRQNKENLREGELEINQLKNRYKDIIPFSHTRVSLLENENVPGSDYINANYIRGASGSPQAYIACQGPLPGTLTDFWRMIWECRVSVLVMACNEFESGKSKCEIYWPHELDSSVIFGPFEIRLLRVRQICQDFLVRKFSIKLLKQPPTQQQMIPKNLLATSQCGSFQHHPLNNLPKSFLPTTSVSASSISSSASSSLSSNANSLYLDTNNSNINSNNNNNLNHIDKNNLNADINNHLNINSDTNSSIKMQIIPSSVQSSSSNNIQNQNADSQNHSQKSTIIVNNTAYHESSSHVQHGNLTRSDDGETRIICQFHYTTWPDHGAPRSMQPILEMVRLMREVQPAEDRPILVHCSAGCGRTGTICCIDYVWGLLRRGELDPSFDLCSIISEMRQQRMAMVQTLEQYILCHRAVAALFIDQLKLIDDHTYENLDYRDGRHEDDNIGPVFI